MHEWIHWWLQVQCLVDDYVELSVSGVDGLGKLLIVDDSPELSAVSGGQRCELLGIDHWCYRVFIGSGVNGRICWCVGGQLLHQLILCLFVICTW